MEAKYKSSLSKPQIPDFEWQETRNKIDRDIFRDVINTGRAIISVAPDDRSKGAMHDIVYTIGLYLNLLHAEFLIKGVPSEAGAEFLSGLFAQVEAGEQFFEDQTLTYDFGQGEKKLVARLLPQGRYEDFVTHGCWFYRSLLWNTQPIATHKFPVLQLYWPDASGFYPWHTACDPQVRATQTLKTIREVRK